MALAEEAGGIGQQFEVFAMVFFRHDQQDEFVHGPSVGSVEGKRIHRADEESDGRPDAAIRAISGIPLE
ncbi:hypothetical protein WL67_22185 [Burkholderia ubonensis]|uniref:Uncharacterized protein n=1 Tax=Burkholderia cepacia TaxID=292 RepID=A0A1B4PYD2_BURCE|nr:hypothetical protein WT26_22655 [Burkholderia cepacia]KVO28214.1 hypothetical protein WJ75_29490 [Burkholderia ubonensis]KWD49429.1 hypothetical protein WL67_22185 [Burkholderia ubonensis]KWD51540.1 hypothetical protein WL66_18210 [Burkholderia ubonensis]